MSDHTATPTPKLLLGLSLASGTLIWIRARAERVRQRLAGLELEAGERGVIAAD